MATIAQMLFGGNSSEEILDLFCKKDVSQAEAKRVTEAFVETHAKSIVNKLNSEVPKGLESIHYEADFPESLFLDDFIYKGITHHVGNFIAKAYQGYKLDSVSGSGMTFKKE
jgi:hypothetical protein